MSMSKKDYEMLARIIRTQYGHHPLPSLPPVEQKTRVAVLDKFVDQLAAELEKDNPRFMKHRWLLAATPSWHQVARGLATPGKGRGTAVRFADRTEKR